MWETRDQNIFFILHIDQRETRPASMLHSSKHCHVYISLQFPLSQRSIKTFVCLKICGFKLESIWEVHCQHPTFMMEEDSLRNSSLLLWGRNEGLRLRLEPVCWTLQNNNAVTAAMMFSSIIFQKLNPSLKKKKIFLQKSSLSVE